MSPLGMASSASIDMGMNGNIPGQGPNLSEPIQAAAAAASGSRALSKHILWRSNCRTNPLNMRIPKLNETQETAIDMDEEVSTSGNSSSSREYEFRYPFSELLLWAVLTKRQEMALCMWHHGEEAMAKALVACRLYKSIAKEAAEDYLEVEICEELKKYAEEFRALSIELLEQCYQVDDAQTLQLLTYELSNWSSETCLSLAVIVNNKQFLAHPCCQILLADLWHGGMRIRSHSNIRVIMGLICPVTIAALEFKSREELMQQPQTAAEHDEEVNESVSSASTSSSSSSDEESGSDSSNESEKDQLFNSRRRRKKEVTAANGGPSHNSVKVSAAVSPRVPSPPPPQKRGRLMSWRIPNGAPRSTSRQSSVLEMKPDARSLSPGGKMVAVTEESGDFDPRKSASDSKLVYAAYKAQMSVASTTKEDTSIKKKERMKNLFSSVPRMRQLKIKKKLYEFYAAPITTFWAWTISFVVFLGAFTYVLLVKTPPTPTWVEWYVFAYVATYLAEHCRKFLMSDMKPWREKARHFFFNYWNFVTTLALLTFVLGFGLRLTTKFRAAGRVILAVDSVLWSLKLLDFSSVHPRMGPYVTMAGKMILNMIYIVVMLFISLLAFGLPRQAITYPNEEWSWLLLRNIFYKPYFMLYGEVYADEIDQCGDEAWDQHLEEGVPISMLSNGSQHSSTCVPGYWVPPILMTFFLLVANILLISMLIAIFNHIFDEADEISQQIWLFQRYRQVMEYESTPFLPPPLTPIYHVWMVIKYIRARRKENRNRRAGILGKHHSIFDFSLKLFLNCDQVEKLHDFEEDCMEEMTRLKEHKKNTSNEERIMRTAERTDTILNRLNDLTSKESLLRTNVTDMESRLAAIEDQQHEILSCVREVVGMLSTIGTRVTSPTPQFDERAASPAIHASGQLLSVTADASSSRSHTHLHEAASVGVEVQPAAISRRTRTTTVCGDPLDADDFAPEMSKTLGSYSSLEPLIHSIKRDPGAFLSSAIRRRRGHEEYTSITDTIEVRSPTLPKKSTAETIINSDFEQPSDEERGPRYLRVPKPDSPVEDSQQITPTATLRRAKPSFVQRQNNIYREMEEEMADQLRERKDATESEMDEDQKLYFRAPKGITPAPSPQITITRTDSTRRSVDRPAEGAARAPVPSPEAADV